MKIETTRFGSIDVPEETLIELPTGMVGFPDNTRFAWIAHRKSEDIAWLQATNDACVAFPLMNAACIGEDYPDIAVSQIADQAGLTYEDETDLALMVVLAANAGGPPTVNLMAPVVINSKTRKGSQVVLVNSRFTTITLTPPMARAAAGGER